MLSKKVSLGKTTPALSAVKTPLKKIVPAPLFNKAKADLSLPRVVDTGDIVEVLSKVHSAINQAFTVISNTNPIVKNVAQVKKSLADFLDDTITSVYSHHTQQSTKITREIGSQTRANLPSLRKTNSTSFPLSKILISNTNNNNDDDLIAVAVSVSITQGSVIKNIY